MAVHKRHFQKAFVVILATLLACWPLPATTHAAPGDLDSTFGTETLVSTFFSDGNALVQAIVVQPDGKIIGAGTNGDFALARFNVDGTLDSSFGVAGKTTTDFFGRGDFARAVALQPDGKIILAGSCEVMAGIDGNDFAVARYRSDGTLDTSFGSGGKVTTDFFGLYDNANAVAMQPDGKIIAAGSTVNKAGQFALARYDVDGSLDSSFGVGGKVSTDSFESISVSSISLQPDGKIIAAGYGFSTNFDFAVVRYNVDGSRDSTFGSGGNVTTDFFGQSDSGVGSALQADGRILVAGRVTKNTLPADTDSAYGLVRYNSNGSLDSTFGSGGKVTTDFPTKGALPHSMVVQSDGKILIAGSCPGSSFFLNSALARYNTDGSLDFSFGTGGKVITEVQGNIETYAIAIQPDNKIVTGSSYLSFTLIRYNNDGSRDLSFRSGGKTTTDFAGVIDQVYAVAVQPDGKILAAGYTVVNQSNTNILAFARYNVDGALDPSFGVGGKVTATFLNLNDVIFAMVLQPDGKIVAGGGASPGGFGLIRLDSDGSLDPSFGTGGKVITQFSEASAGIRALALQPDGYIVAAGVMSERFSSPPNFALARYRPDGSLDSSFGTNGKVTTSLSDRGDQAYAIGLRPDGRIVVAGKGETTKRVVVVAQYHADGSLDKSFGTKGKITTTILGRHCGASALVVQPSGKVVVAGYAENTVPNLHDDFALVRFNDDGSLDSSFGAGGFVTTDFFGKEDVINALVLTPGGKLIAAGLGTLGSSDFGLAAYLDDGSLDSSFGMGGKVTTKIGVSASANALALAPDGRIVAAGRSFPGLVNDDFAIARYEALGGSGGGGGGGVPTFDICVQDESTGASLQVNSQTGEYKFSSCGSQPVTLTGRAKIKVKKSGCLLKLSSNASDHSMTASVNICKKTGFASISVSANGRTFDVNDGDTTNNTCACP